MALIIKNRIKETASITGTGSATLLGASTGYRSFADIGNTNTTYYCIADQAGANWEVGIGTYTLSGTTLARTTVLSNSLGTTALISFTGGTQDIFTTYPAEESVYGSGTTLVAPTGMLLPVANGGTGLGTLSGIAYGNGTSAYSAATAAQVITTLGYTPVHQGGGTGQGTNSVYIGWSGGNLLVQVDATDFGATWPINISGTSAGLGVNQTWQNVKASRVIGTTYTNSTGKPIFISISLYESGQNTSATATATIGGVIVSFASMLNNNAQSNIPALFQLIVPNGTTYVITATGSYTYNAWAELR